MKTILSVIFLFLCSLCSLAQVNEWKTVKHTKEPEKVQQLNLTNFVMHYSILPQKVRAFKGLEVLDLSSVRGSMKLSGGPCIHFHVQSHLKHLPDWIGEFQNLKKIDLAGASRMNFSNELLKIRRLSNLEYLRINPQLLDDELLRSLSQFTQLKELCIEPAKVYPDEHIKQWFSRLKAALPNCKVDIC